MSLTDGEGDILQSALPAKPQRRDALGNAFYYHHFAMMLYIVTGWALPFAPLLWFYVFFIPAVVLQWLFNKNSCVLNNLETLLRTGQWRNPQNREEGGWIWVMACKLTGRDLSHFVIDVFIYSLMAGLWLLGIAHLRHWHF